MDENREYQIFENYIKSVCRKIMSQKKKNEVREELYSHLLEEYERNSALGMDNETAQSAAIEKMGDENEIANNFGALYSIIPTEYMRSSLNFIIWGFVLITFNFDLISTTLSAVTQFLGQMLMLFGLFKLRKTEKRLNIAFGYYIGLLFTGEIHDFLDIYYNLSDVVVNVLLIINLLANLIYYYLLVSGLNKLCQTTITEEDKTPHLYFGYIMLILQYAIAYLAVTANEQNLPLITILPVIIFIFQIRRAKFVLAHEEPEFELSQTIENNEKKVYCCLVVLFIIIPIVSMYLSTTRTPEYAIYNSADLSVEETSIEKARQNMLDLDFPEEYLADLPDREVLEYANATYMGKYDYYKGDGDAEKKEAETVELFCFFYPDGTLRALYRIELCDELSTPYRKGFYVELDNYEFVQNYNASIKNTDKTDGFGRFFIALSQVDNNTVSSEYFEDKSPYGIVGREIAAYEYSYPKNSTQRRAYFATSAYIQDSSKPKVLFVDARHYTIEAPFYLDYTISDLMEINMNGRFISTDFTIRNPQYFFNVDYFPEYKVKDEMIDFDKIEN